MNLTKQLSIELTASPVGVLFNFHLSFCLCDSTVFPLELLCILLANRCGLSTPMLPLVLYCRVIKSQSLIAFASPITSLLVSLHFVGIN